MNAKVQNSIQRIADDARSRFNAVLAGARRRTENAAGVVKKGKGPVKTVSKLSLKLTAVSHKAVDKIVKQQTKLVEHQIDGFAGRLKAAAGATDVRNFVGTQVRLVREDASQFVGDARDTFGILVNAGVEVGGLLKSTADELRGVAPSKQAVKKTVRKKKAAVKKVAKKVETEVAAATGA